MRIISILFLLMLLVESFASNVNKDVTNNVPRIQDFIEEVQYADSGFVNYYLINERHYLEIPDEIIGRDILTTITILRGAQHNKRNMGKRFGYGGDSMNNDLVRFTRSDEGIDLVRPELNYIEDKDAEFKDYYNSLVNPIVKSFNAIARSEHSTLIDITEYYLGDSELFSLSAASAPLDLGGYIPQESYSKEVHSFPTNINFKSMRCYAAGNMKESTYSKLLWEVGASWFLLPDKPMKMRLTDSRVGYFNTKIRGQVYKKSDNDIIDFANRWRLEPKPEDEKKYLSGELVEPVKPIVFYIDRTMPSFLIEEVKKAVNSWQTAFEQAGFKNAIHAEMEPIKEENPEFSIEDARFSYISYKASPVPNAYGPMVVDPRTGEVICSHVAIFHSVMDLAQMWYFAMCSPSDPEARIFPLEHNLMSKLMNKVVTHEVGHTLGLRHNFLGSTNFEVDSLRSNDFIKHNGLGTSIMDYERYNYVAQPEDEITQENLLPRIGVYDEFAIEWGYRYFSDSISVPEQTKRLKMWVQSELKKGGRYYVEESVRNDPRVQAEDCGKDQVYANELGMKNLKYILKNIENWTNEQTTEDYVLLKRRYYYVLHQYEAYIGHVLQLLGGYYTEDCSCGEKVSFSYKAVSAEQQKKAMDFIEKYFLTEPKWLLNPGFIDKVDFDYGQRVEGPAMNRIGQIVGTSMKYSVSESIDAESTSYIQFIDYLFQALFPVDKNTKAVSAYTRMLQRDVLTQITINLENTSNIPLNIYQELKRKIDAISNYATGGMKSADRFTRVHYLSMINFIEAWKTGKQSF